jgi:hypothetical protein
MPELCVRINGVTEPLCGNPVMAPFLSDMGSAAVYSPLHASMRASDTHRSFFGTARPQPHAASDTLTGHGPALESCPTASQASQLRDCGRCGDAERQLRVRADACEDACVQPCDSQYDASAYQAASVASPASATAQPRTNGPANGKLSTQPVRLNGRSSLAWFESEPMSGRTVPTSSTAAETQVNGGESMQGKSKGLDAAGHSPAAAAVASSNAPVRELHQVQAAASRHSSALSHVVAAPGLLGHASIPVQVTLPSQISQSHSLTPAPSALA